MNLKIKTCSALFILIGKSLILPGQDTFKNYTQTIPNSIQKFNMVSVKGGSFQIGSDDSEVLKEEDEIPSRKIVVSDFWIAETELTYDLFQLFFEELKDPEPKVDGITRPSPPYIDFTLGMGKTGGYPANSMQQYGAIMFCKWLYQKTGVFYRLPTEGEWEYAAKLNLDEKAFKDSTQIQSYEWFSNNADNRYHKVATKKPGRLGLYDMLGNVSEWTIDQYDKTYFSKIKDSTLDPVIQKIKRHPTTVRGGNYNTPAFSLRPSNRTMSDPAWNRRDPQLPKSKWWNADAPFVGFRLVRPIKKVTATEIENFFDSYLK